MNSYRFKAICSLLLGIFGSIKAAELIKHKIYTLLKFSIDLLVKMLQGDEIID